MRAAKVIGIGQRRLLILLTATIAIAVTLSFGLMRANATTIQITTTSISITDANTGLPISGTIQSTELVTITATVTGTSSAPSGTFGLQTTTNGTSYTPMCDSGGNCMWNVSPTGALTSQGSLTTYLPAGTYDIQATFRGTNGSSNSSSPKPGTPVNVSTVTVHNTTTTVIANPNSITAGQSTTLTATVASDDGSGTPSGTVTFYALVGQVRTFIAQGTLDANGQASFSSSAWAAQTYQIEADYAGRVFTDANGNTVSYQTSSGTATLNVGAPSNPQVSTATSVTATPNPIRSDQTVHLVATVVQSGASTMAGATLSSKVTFTAIGQTGSAVLGTATLVPNGDGTGTAVLDAGGWIPGTYTIQAQYFGNIYFLGSSGNTSTIVVNQARPTTASYVHDTKTYVGDIATLSAQVLDTQSQQPVPAGEQVVLTANDNVGTSCLAVTDGNGIASCTATFPSAGTYTITASYAGDSTFDPSVGFGQITVLQVPTNVTVTNSTNPVPTGATETLTGHLTDARTGTPISGESLTLQLNSNETCTTGATDAVGNASCTVTVSESSGSYPTAVSFAGDSRYVGSSGAGTLSVVNVLPTHWTYTGTTSVYAGQPATISFVLKDGTGQVLANRPVTLGFNGTSYSVTTNASGIATQPVTAPTAAGSYTATASYGGEAGYLASTGSGSIQVNTIPTSVTYTGDTNVNGGAPATLKFVLKDQGGNTLANMPVTLTFQGTNYNVTTDGNGVASATATAPVNAGVYPVTAAFGGHLPYSASTGSGSVTVTTIPTTITYVGDNSVTQGATATLAAKLLDSGGNPLANEGVALTLATGEMCSGITNAAGVASCQVVVNEATTLVGSPYGVAISFGGDLPYLASTGTGALAVVAPYSAPAAGFCSTNKCESVIANPTVLSPTQLQVLYTDDSALPTSAPLAPTAILSNGEQLSVTTTPTCAGCQGAGGGATTPVYVDTYGGSTSVKNQSLVTIKLPNGLIPGQYSVRIFINDGDGDWDQWTWTITVGLNGTVTSGGTGGGGSGSGQLASGTTSCNGVLGGAGAAVTVAASATCTLLPGTTVSGGVTVAKGGTLFATGVTIGTDLVIQGGASVCGSSIGNNITSTGATGAVVIGGGTCAGNTVAHDLSVTGSTGGVSVVGNQVGHDLNVKGDGPSTVVSSNTVGHDANCGANAGQTGSDNSSGHKTSCPI